MHSPPVARADPRTIGFSCLDIVALGAVFSLKNGKLLPMQTFDPAAGQVGASSQGEAFPYGSAASGNYVFLAQPGQVVILAGQ